MTKKHIKGMFHEEKLQITKDAIEMIHKEFTGLVGKYIINAKSNKIKRIKISNSEYWRYSFGQLVNLMKKRKEL